MFLRRLAMQNYCVFANAEFPLTTTPDRPIVLITANNGGGKTSTLNAFRLALHGRRAFDIPLGEKEYNAAILSRFHNGQIDRPCKIELDFDYVDLHQTHSVQLKRAWRATKGSVSESITLLVDGSKLEGSEANDLLSTIVPPEVARYFFFDAERIKELADWDTNDEAQLFDAVGDLLGFRILDQLARDLIRVRDQDSGEVLHARDFTKQVAHARETEGLARAAFREERAQSRRHRGNYDRALGHFKRLGGIAADHLTQMRERLAALQAEHDGLSDEMRRAAHDILPLLCGRSLREKLLIELQRRQNLEERETAKVFFNHHRSSIEIELRNRGLSTAMRRIVMDVLEETAHGKPVAVSFMLPSLSRSEEAWMQRVIERELPILEERSRQALRKLLEIENEMRQLKSAIKSAPEGDPKAEASLADLETAQRELVEHEQRLKQSELSLTAATDALQNLIKQERLQRVAIFQHRRLVLREDLLEKTLAALPILQGRIQQSKELRFGQYLQEALQQLWNKRDRVDRVKVDFENRHITLLHCESEINKFDLSSGEKQLFATGFIYSLAKLSGRHIPFVIDTPLGRLDHAHRRRFISNFLPDASHQTILLSTDTEIVGPLYSELRPLISQQFDLATFNGALTEPVQLALA